ncbi:MAG: metal-dependent transcriptional regulator [Bacilli bacterium]|nr:metal-dependent transcriptional regulator [Bacilli bacterium]
MKYRESEEMYLETILLLKEKLPVIRSIDIANELNYSRASVSRAVNLLKEKGYITIENAIIEFTPKGFTVAHEIYERHETITKVLAKIGVPLDTAEDNACRIEHVITPELLEYFKKFIDE